MRKYFWPKQIKVRENIPSDEQFTRPTRHADDELQSIRKFKRQKMPKIIESQRYEKEYQNDRIH